MGSDDWEKRLDDTEEVMTRRLAEFHEKSAPYRSFFRGEINLSYSFPSGERDDENDEIGDDL